MSATSNKVVLEVESRSEAGKNACRRIRAAGRVPGNVYGMEVAPFSVSVDPRRVDDVLRLESGRNTIVTLSMTGGDESRDVIIRELQRDPVSERILHVDFVRIDPDKVMHVSVPVRLLGTPIGVKTEGGIIDFVNREVEVNCLPSAIPEHFDIDVEELHIGQHISVKDLTVGAGVEMLSDPESIIAVVAAPKAEAEPTAEEAAAVEGEVAEGAEAAEGKEEQAEGGSGE